MAQYYQGSECMVDMQDLQIHNEQHWLVINNINKELTSHDTPMSTWKYTKLYEGRTPNIKTHEYGVISMIRCSLLNQLYKTEL